MFWAFHGQAYDFSMFGLWRKSLEDGNEECKKCRVFRRGCKVCPECGGVCEPMEPHRYFPGWKGGELPVLVTGGYSTISTDLHSNLVSNWSSLAPDSNGVPFPSVGEMTALNFDNGLDWVELELLSDLFHAMTSGHCQGVVMANEYRKLKRSR